VRANTYAASSRGRIGFGENAGKLHARLLTEAPMPTGKGKRAANISGFDLLLAPHAKRRAEIILSAEARRRGDRRESNSATEKSREIRQRRLTWAELMRRVFAIDVLRCDGCGGSRTIIAAITQPEAIRAILICLGIPTAAKRQHPPRAPPQSELCFP